MSYEKYLNILDRGFVRYVDHLGSDSRIVESARVCYESKSKGEEQDKKLLKYLHEHEHLTPFEQCAITYNIKMPIFVARQFFRHRTFKFNEMSGRYTQIPSDFYIPSELRRQDSKNKQSSSSEEFNPLIGEDLIKEMELTSKHLFNLYNKLLDYGVSRELARIILPMNTYTEIYVTCDLRNLMHFFKLRLAKEAQYEIRVVANGMYNIFVDLFPWSAECIGEMQ